MFTRTTKPVIYSGTPWQVFFTPITGEFVVDTLDSYGGNVSGIFNPDGTLKTAEEGFPQGISLTEIEMANAIASVQ